MPWCSTVSEESSMSSLSRVLEETFNITWTTCSQSSGETYRKTFLDKHMKGEKPLHRQCIVCGPGERERWVLPHSRPGEKRIRRCDHMTGYECRQCNVSLCISCCFEIYHTQQGNPFGIQDNSLVPIFQQKNNSKCII